MNLKFDTSGFRGFWILLYKGFLLRKRHYMCTAFEIVFPVLIAAIPAIIASEIGFSGSHGRSYMENKTIFSSFDPFEDTHTEYNNRKVLFAYAPLNTHTEMLINNSVELWRRFHPSPEFEIKGLQHPEEVEFYCLNQIRQKYDIAAVGTIFNNIHSSEEKLPSGLDYTIRYSGRFSSYRNTMKYRFRFYQENDDDYRKSYFLSWQASVEKIFIEKKTLELGIQPLDYNISMQQFPFPERKVFEGFSLASQIPMFIIFCFLAFIINLMRRVIEEKSNGSKELMKMMGMSNFTYWISTFFNFFLIGAVVMLIITIIYKSPLKYSVVVLEKSNFLLILILFLLFMASLILFCLAVSTFFNKAVFGIIFLVIIYNVGTSVLQSLVFTDEPPSLNLLTLSVFVKLCVCLFPPGALNAAFQIISIHESSGEGANWSNVNKFDVIPDLNLSQIMLTLLFSCFLYGVIIWYVDAVWPWQYGVPKPFYFLCTKSYWCGYKEEHTDDILLGPDSDVKSSEFFEDDPTGVSPGVVINNLSKVFRTGFQTKVAVNNLSLNIYNGQITALLGHNGAGKTTTINILTGLYSPSSGSASINGWDIFKHTTKSRQSLGVCPQHNVLFDTLTVEEHLKLYGALKGVSWTQLNQEINSILDMLQLTNKKTELTKNLSGGMKRKLSLGIAVVGGSKVLFLDEPTSGMDVEARRGVWDTLLEIRHDRAIVLTTHYMEEADILGDRIAIMADGEVQCCGSSLFLKKKFGTGYHLHIVKEENFNMGAVNEILVKYIPQASPENEYEREVTFSLTSKTNSSFGELFGEIENNKDALGINSCGVTVTTMEDVFLNVTNIAELKVKKNVENEAVVNTDENELKDIYMESNLHAKILNFRYWFNQFRGLLMKRLHYSKRHWGILVSQLVLPFILLSLCFYFINLATSGRSSAVPLRMDIEKVYGKTDGFISGKHELSNAIKEVLQRNGVKTATVDDPSQYILDYGRNNLGHYIKNILVGGSVEEDSTLNLTAWFNGLPYHSVPMSLLLMDSAILKQVTQSGSITLTSHPLPSVYEDNYEDKYHTMETSFANVFFPLALSFLSSSFVLVPIHERASKAKLLQLMTGIPAAMYWFAMFVWDFFISTIISLLLIIPFAVFAGKVFLAPHSEAVGTAILLMIFYGWSSIPFSYLFTLIFQKPNTGFSVVNAICILGGVVLSSIFSAISAIVKVNTTAKVFSWLFKFLPAYSLSSGFGKLFAIAYSNAYCDMQDQVHLEFKCNQTSQSSGLFQCCKDICGDLCKKQIHPINFDDNGCAAELLFLFSDGVLYFTLLLLFESSVMAKAGRVISQSFNRLRKRMNTTTIQIGDSNIEDSDVLQEEERVRSNYLQVASNEALVALSLSKQFKNIKAVDRLTFGIHKTECFGLLGVNGAGKTTTFRMLTGDCYPDEGNALIGSISVITNLKQFQSYIGYCPQFDALLDRLSAREMITLFARLRGLSGPRLERAVNALIKMTDLTQYADKPSMVYSGGNKRKLSIALALIGQPSLLLLDEPTAGVDPVSRRKIWKILSLARTYTGAAVILTTHSMEESEALCSRLAIMVNGRFRCLGSIQQLKTKFGQGYTLIIKMKKEEQAIPQSMNALKVYIDTNLPGAQLKDDHQGMLQYHIVDPTVTLSYLFKFMDDMKQKCNLEDYVVSDTSLEQIFLAFARSQRVVAA